MWCASISFGCVVFNSNLWSRVSGFKSDSTTVTEIYVCNEQTSFHKSWQLVIEFAFFVLLKEMKQHAALARREIKNALHYEKPQNYLYILCIHLIISMPFYRENTF